MTKDEYNRPAQGADNWNVPLNENFADLGVEVAQEVATWSDLPATTDVTQSSDGQWPVYRVAADEVFVRVTDSAEEIVGGLGSADHPLPESHHEAINTDEARFTERPVRTTSDYVLSGDGTRSSPWAVDRDNLIPTEGREVFFDEGQYLLDSLVYPDLDYDEEAFTLSGSGPRVTRIFSDGTDGNMLDLAPAVSASNMGTIKDMTVWGRQPDGTTRNSGHIIYNDGTIFDMNYRNLYLRYTPGDAIRHETSSSGVRVINNWLETSTHGLYLAGGSRQKVRGNHYAGNSIGIELDGPTRANVADETFNNHDNAVILKNVSQSTFENIVSNRTTGADPIYAFEEQSTCEDNSGSVKVYDTIAGMLVGGDDGEWTIRAENSNRQAVQVAGDGNTVEVKATDWDQNGSDYPAVIVSGANNSVAVTSASQPNRDTYNLIRVTGDFNHITELSANAGTAWTLEVQSSASMTVIEDIDLGPNGNISVTDNGSRTVFGGRGYTSSASPGSGSSQWDGYEDVVYRQNWVVEDRRVSAPYDYYRADSAGNWVQIG